MHKALFLRREVSVSVFQGEERSLVLLKKNNNMEDGVCSRIYVKGGGGCSGESGGGGGKGSGSSKCGRWNPTAEQVKVLTELFRSGLRTPSSDQIQKISHHLSFYGKIESKNVFYWFQNHKARERQKRRKLSLPQQQHFILPPSSNLQRMFVFHLLLIPQFV